MSHTIRYTIRNHDWGHPSRLINVHATAEELTAFADRGYLVRERLIGAEELERLRGALEEIIARETGRDGPGEGMSRGRRYGGLFLRHLHDKHPRFLDFIARPEFVTVARAMLGPQVRLRGFTARVAFPGAPDQETEWHQHHRVVPDPVPPWYCRPQTIDVLVYLDDLDEATGPLAVIPGSHARLDDVTPGEHYADHPGQVTLALPAGSAVLMNANLWHRAMPTRSAGRRRRLLLFGYAPTWLRAAPYGTVPADGLSRAWREGDDPELRELAGKGGYT